MARIERTTLVDDFDGSSADETIEFMIDSIFYEIDLSQAHAAAFRGALASHIAAARRVLDIDRGRRVRSAADSVMTAERRQRNSAIRSWARERGYRVATRGRIPTEIVKAYADCVNPDPNPILASNPSLLPSAPRPKEA
ncbi:Lsr2 family protein [Pseudonocardia sp. ICBG162]|uniref:histone-like nucleoid-structuring protein Lsr2 n=1 Tax=Pseudonocardia sp. ICBG162 TaxID=2846761 RepID=UPI00272EB7FD|nr:Lsr2 family protein [Pseudonocardia sp. ICBG162]